MSSELKQAVESIKHGGTAIFPTDTAFGIGCRIDDEKAVKRLFAIKQRSETQATPVLVDGIAMAEEYFQPISEKVKKLMQMYWPGALTIVYPCREEKVSSYVRGGSNTIGLRMPNHDVPLSIIQEIGVPIIGTSANFHGKPTPYTISDLHPALMKKVDIVVPGICSLRQASTVVDCSTEPWKVLREGAIHLSLRA